MIAKLAETALGIASCGICEMWPQRTSPCPRHFCVDAPYRLRTVEEPEVAPQDRRNL